MSRIVEKLRERTNAAVQSKDVYNTMQRDKRIMVDGLVEAHDLISPLMESVDFAYNCSTDRHDQLTGLIFASRRALAQFSFMSFVLLMDATYKTNRFNMPLLLMSSVDQHGSTYIVACCLFADETMSSYSMALMSFKQLFGAAVPTVDVIITDQDNAMIGAIAARFPDSQHQLCAWHLAMNVKKHIGEGSPIRVKFLAFTYSKNEIIAEQIYLDMVAGCASREKAYLERVYGLRAKFVEV